MADEARIEGARPVLEALRAGRRRVLEITVPGRASTPGLRELVALARERGIPLRTARGGSDARVVARAEPYPEQPFEALLDDPRPFLVALDRVTDVGNLGSIARSAEVAGATGLVLEHRHAPPIAEGALRASAGALEHLRVGRAPNLRKALELARGEGLQLLAADAAGPPLAVGPPLDPERGLVWVFGSEDRGLRDSIRALADRLVGIPLHGRMGSLGVAAAAAHLLQRTAELWPTGPGRG